MTSSTPRALPLAALLLTAGLPACFYRIDYGNLPSTQRIDFGPVITEHGVDIAPIVASRMNDLKLADAHVVLHRSATVPYVSGTIKLSPGPFHENTAGDYVSKSAVSRGVMRMQGAAELTFAIGPDKPAPIKACDDRLRASAAGKTCLLKRTVGESILFAVESDASTRLFDSLAQDIAFHVTPCAACSPQKLDY